MVFPGVPERTGSVLPRVFSVARSIVGRSGVPVDFPPEGRSGRDPSVPPKEGFFFHGLPSSGGPMIRVAAAETGPPSVRPVSGMWTSSFLRRRARLLFVIGTVTRPAVKKTSPSPIEKDHGIGCRAGICAPVRSASEKDPPPGLHRQVPKRFCPEKWSGIETNGV